MQVAASAAGALSPSHFPAAVLPAPPATAAAPSGTNGAASVALADAAEPADVKVKQEPSGEGDEMENSSEENSDDEKGSVKEEEDSAGRGGGGEDAPQKQQHTEAMEVEDAGSEDCNASNKRKAQEILEPAGVPPQGAGGAAEERKEMEEDEQEEEEEEEEDSEDSSSDSDSPEALQTK